MAKVIVLGSHPDSFIHYRFEMLATMAEHHEVYACAPDIDSNVRNLLAKIGVKTINVNMARTGLNPVKDLGSLFNLWSVFRRYKPDMLLSYTVKPVVYGSIAATLAGVKKRYSMITGLGSYYVHNDLKTKIIRCAMSVLYKFALMVNTRVFFQNPDDIADFARMRIFNDPSRTSIINGSGVNTEYFSPMPLPKEQTTFLMIARLIASKGINEYLAAAKMLKAHYPKARCLLVGWFEGKGESIDEAHLQQYIDEGVIEYLGKLDDVRPAIVQAGVYVLPSYREGTPKSVLEAMSCGRAIITTDVPGCRETIDENGVLVPSKDVEALFKAMENFVKKPELVEKMGKISRQIAQEKYDVDKVNRVILSLMGLSYV